MKLKTFIIIFCLLLFGCKNTSTISRIEKIGQLTPGNGGIYHLEVYNSETGSYEIYKLHHLYRIISDNHYELRDDDGFF